MAKIFIKNRKGQQVAVLVDQPPSKDKGLVFVMNGLGSWKERPIMQSMSKPFIENGYTVVRFDATNSFGESDGRIEDATNTNYYEDLEDVIQWASGQEWYQEPFVLTGHSFDGICTGLFAQKYPDKVKAWVPINSTISGKLSIKARPELSESWQKLGYRELVDWDPKNPRAVYKLPWSHMEDRLKYDLLKHSDKLIIPTLIIVGELDDSCLPWHQKLLFDKLTGPKELCMIAGAPHTIKDPIHLAKLEKIIVRWIKQIQ